MPDPKNLYLDLLKKALTFYLWEDRVAATKFPTPVGIKYKVFALLQNYLNARGLQIAAVCKFDPEKRRNGTDWPLVADTMVGLKRLDNLQYCVETVVEDGIPGDLLEAGVWRGGASILMRAVLKVLGVEDRAVWLADSFEGLPLPNKDKYPADSESKFHTYEYLSVSEDEVIRNFRRYDLYDEKIKILKGWFSETFPTAPIDKLAVLRMDGDMYESTMDTLNNLYDKVSPGGFIVVDDYAIESCKAAITEYRGMKGIKEDILPIDESSVFWRRSAASS